MICFRAECLGSTCHESTAVAYHESKDLKKVLLKRITGSRKESGDYEEESHRRRDKSLDVGEVSCSESEVFERQRASFGMQQNSSSNLTTSNIARHNHEHQQKRTLSSKSSSGSKRVAVSSTLHSLPHENEVIEVSQLSLNVV